MTLGRKLLDSFLEKRRTSEFWFEVLAFILLGFAFWPVTQWFAESAQEQNRLLYSLTVLALATIILIRYDGAEIKNTLTLNPSSRRALIASFILLLANFIGYRTAPDEWRGLTSLIIIPAYCCGLAALFRFIFGEGTRSLTRTTAGTLCGFLLLSILMQPMDWPLRGLAGHWSASVLEFIGKSVELGLVKAENYPPKLILWVEQHPFHVASECNGFGVILTSVLIGLLLALYRRLGVFNTALNIFAGLILGFIFNILRIVIIVLLAPTFMNHYSLMHEVVGNITYWGCLVLLWLLLNGPTQERREA